VAVVLLDDLVAHGGDPALEQGVETLGRRHRQVPGRDHHLARLVALVLRGLRRRNAQDQLRAEQHLLLGVGDGGPHTDVVVVGEPGLEAGAAFHIDPMSSLGDCPHPTRGEADTMLERPAILDQPDVHDRSLLHALSAPDLSGFHHTRLRRATLRPPAPPRRPNVGWASAHLQSRRATRPVKGNTTPASVNFTSIPSPIPTSRQMNSEGGPRPTLRLPQSLAGSGFPVRHGARVSPPGSAQPLPEPLELLLHHPA